MYRPLVIDLPELETDVLACWVISNDDLSSDMFLNLLFSKKGGDMIIKQFGSIYRPDIPDLDPNCYQNVSADDKSKE